MCSFQIINWHHKNNDLLVQSAVSSRHVVNISWVNSLIRVYAWMFIFAHGSTGLQILSERACPVPHSISAGMNYKLVTDSRDWVKLWVSLPCHVSYVTCGPVFVPRGSNVTMLLHSAHNEPLARTWGAHWAHFSLLIILHSTEHTAQTRLGI